jgi:hypothetical protein
VWVSRLVSSYSHSVGAVLPVEEADGASGSDDINMRAELQALQKAEGADRAEGGDGPGGRAIELWLLSHTVLT